MDRGTIAGAGGRLKGAVIWGRAKKKKEHMRCEDGRSKHNLYPKASFEEDFDDNNTGLKFSGDILCIKRVFKLVTRKFLCYTLSN